MRHFLFVLSLAACAQPGVDDVSTTSGLSSDTPHRHHHHGDRFAKDDADGDGFITSGEVPSDHWERLKNADADGDGKVSKAEIETFMASRHGRH